jgi:uncharacterized repeat protein (TIGR03806 family)
MDTEIVKQIRKVAMLLSLCVSVACGTSDAGGGGTGASGGMGGSAGMGGTGGTIPGVPEKLSGWGLFADISKQVPAEGVVPYDVTSPLFSDYAVKPRFVSVPEGKTIQYSNTERWQSPVGTIYVKTFAYPVDARDPDLGLQLIETRLLVHEESGWKVHTYAYGDDPSDADRLTTGANLSVSWIDIAGTPRTIESYRIPSNGECRKCHNAVPNTRTLGPSTGMLNMDNDYGEGPVNQIDHFVSLGWLAPTPPPEDERLTYARPFDPESGADVHERTRAYFSSNCSHCHAPDGEAAEHQLFLDYASMDPVTGNPFNWGVCKRPTAASRTECKLTFDVVPLDPNNSLLLCRVESTDPVEMMPPVGRTVTHTEAVELIRAWIDGLDPGPCSP